MYLFYEYKFKLDNRIISLFGGPLQQSEKAMASHSSTLAWKIPWMEELGRLQSMGLLSRTRLSDFTFTFHFHALEKEMATHSSVAAWRIPGTGEPGGLSSMGSHRVGHDWSDSAAAAAAGPHESHVPMNSVSVEIKAEIAFVVVLRFQNVLSIQTSPSS